MLCAPLSICFFLERPEKEEFKYVHLIHLIHLIRGIASLMPLVFQAELTARLTLLGQDWFETRDRRHATAVVFSTNFPFYKVVSLDIDFMPYNL